MNRKECFPLGFCPHRLRHARLPCPSLSSGVCSNSCPLGQWCHPTILHLPLLLLPSIFASVKVFSNESTFCIRWPKYWSFSFNISSTSEHPGLISFKMDWLDLLAVQGTFKELSPHRSSKALKSIDTQLSLQKFSRPSLPA